MSTIAELEKHKPGQGKKRFTNTYRYFGEDVSPINSPATIANFILNRIQHTVTYGAQFIAPMGQGKTTAATVIAHHIHTKRPEFLVTWGDAEDFMNLKEFFSKQPKQPSVFIFDDITGALKQMGEKDMQANFNILTKVRWMMDPEKGKIPTVLFTTSHYSKNMEKEFRAVLGMSCFCDFGNEERTNIDSIAPKGTLARYCVEKFSRIADTMFSDHEFYLKTVYGTKIKYVTDKPLRPFVAVAGNRGYVTVFSHMDVCNHCTKKKHANYVEPNDVYDIIFNGYGKAGIQALKMALWRRGHYLALGKNVAPASDFVERKVLASLTTDFAELTNVIFRKSHKKPPQRIYRHKELEKETLTELKEKSIKVELDDPVQQDDP